MTPNEIKAEARHLTAVLVLAGLYDHEGITVKKIDADKKYAVGRMIDGQTAWTEITITAKKDGYNPDEQAAAIEAKKKARNK